MLSLVACPSIFEPTSCRSEMAFCFAQPIHETDSVRASSETMSSGSPVNSTRLDPEEREVEKTQVQLAAQVKSEMTHRSVQGGSVFSANSPGVLCMVACTAAGNTWTRIKAKRVRPLRIFHFMAKSARAFSHVKQVEQHVHFRRILETRRVP